MTIIYQYRVATTSLGGFLKLLRAWRGSVYKLMYKELVIFVSLYALVSSVYRLALTQKQKRKFESLAMDLHSVSTAIPLSFVLGFYVTIIVQRWWEQFTNVPWPDRVVLVVVVVEVVVVVIVVVVILVVVVVLIVVTIVVVVVVVVVIVIVVVEIVVVVLLVVVKVVKVVVVLEAEVVVVVVVV
ncbi:bestrophin homolog [Elysia marginata]|uniref:Bestrophin homolog n=1 Tax=Elysia marginata TaxID=1093978 RepID=A0AAV4JB63_9GAST|nr:bestrophin homolog [Elysia marginata]